MCAGSCFFCIGIFNSRSRCLRPGGSVRGPSSPRSSAASWPLRLYVSETPHAHRPASGLVTGAPEICPSPDPPCLSKHAGSPPPHSLRPQTRDASRTLSASWNGPVFVPLQLGLQNKSAAPRPPGHIHSAPCDLRPPPGCGSRFLSELPASTFSSFAKLPECVYKSKKAALSPFRPGGSYWIKL